MWSKSANTQERWSQSACWWLGKGHICYVTQKEISSMIVVSARVFFCWLKFAPDIHANSHCRLRSGRRVLHGYWNWPRTCLIIMALSLFNVRPAFVTFCRQMCDRVLRKTVFVDFQGLINTVIELMPTLAHNTNTFIDIIEEWLNHMFVHEMIFGAMQADKSKGPFWEETSNRNNKTHFLKNSFWNYWS